MTNEEYFTACKQFDWYYSFSDDNRVYTRESKNEAALVTEAKNDPKKMQIFMDWKNYMFSREGWSTPKAPKPELENYYD